MYQQILGICSTNEIGTPSSHWTPEEHKICSFSWRWPEIGAFHHVFSGSFALIHTQNSRRQMFFFLLFAGKAKGKTCHHVYNFDTGVVPHHSMTKGNWPWHAWRDWVFSPAAYWPGLSSSTTCLGTRRSYWKLKTAAFWRCKMSVFGYRSKLCPRKKTKLDALRSSGVRRGSWTNLKPFTLTYKSGRLNSSWHALVMFVGLLLSLL
jgi:hypothetical protein